MFFKRIEMTGFKSFATRIVMDFLPGVTVVVGPNGCGKSNIFDAIRWVLGEQNARSLRGNRMGDVIFQGSATYKPMGCAQVTLVINNEDHRLPIDFSEVSITRRLYRSGESEYLLNRVPCRLKDLQELFLDTGVGTESYSIMEQGRVDEIVRARPEERRLLFEEAAGISKYKTRKAEALRKLERTEQDLTRLADRVAECRTRCISLKRQASKAERYKALRDAADAAERKIMSLDNARLRADLQKREREFRIADDRLTAIRSRSDGVQARRERLQLRIEEADQRLRDLSIQKEDQRQYINDAAREIVRLREMAEGQRRRARDMDSQIEDARLRVEELAANLADARAEEARLTVQAIRFESQQNVRRAEYERLRADSEATHSKIHELRRTVEAANDEVLRLRNEQSRLEILIEQSASAVEEFERQKKDLEESVERLTAQIDQKRELVDGLGRRLHEQEAAWNEVRQEALKALDARDVLRGEHRKAEQELNQARSRLQALERLASDYEGYYGGVRAVMRAASEQELFGIIGVVPELIQSIDPDHDLAIEVALGNHVQDIVAKTADDAKRAIDFLKRSDRGRATFLPLDIIDGREAGRDVEQALSRSGVVGLASRLVAYDRYIEAAVQNLLGRTIVTEHIDVSLALIRSGQRHRTVTLDGQLTFPSGALTGGSRNQSQIISRQREITDLAAQAKDLEEKEADFARRITRREQEMVDLEARGANLREEINRMRLEMGAGETELASLRETRTDRETRLEQLREKAETSEQDSRRRHDELAAARQALEAAQVSLAEHREQLGQMEEAVYGRGEEVDRLGKHVSEVDQEITRLRARASHLGENANAFGAERMSLLRRVTALRGEQERAREEAETHREQAVRVNQEKYELELEVSGIDEKCTRAAREKEEAQQAIHAENEQSSRLMRDLNEATNAQSEAQIELVNVRARLEQLEERAGDKFDQTLEEVLEAAGVVEEDRSDLREELEGIQNDLRRMGDNINMHALVEYQEESDRYEFLTTQEQDLIKARDSLRETIATVDRTTRELFWDAFEKIRANFVDVYRRLFGGGKADLLLQEVEGGDALLDGGIEVVAQPPGKKLQSVSLLSGGEKALTAVSLMFAIFMYKPSPFCVMDEIDAPLDDANVMRFREMLRSFSERTQFIIITHNKITMELADTLYGITMQETGVSSLVSVAFEQVEQLEAAGAAGGTA